VPDAPEHPEWRRRLEQARDEVVPWIEDAVSLAGLTVLEYGCGQGAVSCAVAPRCARHIGYDIDDDAIRLARDHLRRRDIANSELYSAGVDDVSARVLEHAGEVDVFLLYAVLEHLSVDERLQILRIAREVVREHGHVVVCESPNRLVGFDHHTGQMPFLHALPGELALRYYQRSPRRDFVEAIDEARAAGGDAAARTALTRWGTGVSYHELELVFEDLANHTVASNYDLRLYPSRPVRWEELRLAAMLDAWRPDLPPCWSRSWIDTVLCASPRAVAPVHVRPWHLRLEHDVPGAAMLADGRVELRPGARLAVGLPVASGELHVGLMADDTEHALRVHTAAGVITPPALASQWGVTTSHAVAALPQATERLELELATGGCVTYVGYRGAADPIMAESGPRGW
jgi:SAM-dependent methyltransferase